MAASARVIRDMGIFLMMALCSSGGRGKGSVALADDRRRGAITEGERGCEREGHNCDRGNCRNDMSMGTW
jgi:hypothetical protein